jgi:hypothetical protein
MSNRQSPPEDSLMLLARRAAIHQQRAAEQQAQAQAEVQARAISSMSATEYDLASRYAAAAGEFTCTILNLPSSIHRRREIHSRRLAKNTN